MESLLALAATQLGLFTRDQARACDVNDGMLRRRVARGQLVRLSRRLFRIAGTPETRHPLPHPNNNNNSVKDVPQPVSTSTATPNPAMICFAWNSWIFMNRTPGMLAGRSADGLLPRGETGASGAGAGGGRSEKVMMVA